MYFQFVLKNVACSKKDVSDAHIKNSELLRKFVSGIQTCLVLLNT